MQSFCTCLVQRYIQTCIHARLPYPPIYLSIYPGFVNTPKIRLVAYGYRCRRVAYGEYAQKYSHKYAYAVCIQSTRYEKKIVCKFILEMLHMTGIDWQNKIPNYSSFQTHLANKTFDVNNRFTPSYKTTELLYDDSEPLRCLLTHFFLDVCTVCS